MLKEAGLLEYIAHGTLVGAEKDVGRIILPGLPGNAEPSRHSPQPGQAAQDGGLAAARGPEQRCDASQRCRELDIQAKGAELPSEGRLDGILVRHYAPPLPVLFCRTIIERITANENASMPPANRCASVHRSVSTSS